MISKRARDDSGLWRRKDEVVACDEKTNWRQNRRKGAGIFTTGNAAVPAQHFGPDVPGRGSAAIRVGAGGTRRRPRRGPAAPGPEPQRHAHLHLGGPEVPLRGSA